MLRIKRDLKKRGEKFNEMKMASEKLSDISDERRSKK